MMPTELETWIDSVEANLIPVLKADQRFANRQELVGSFRQKVAACKDRPDQIKQIIEFANELAAAECLLARMGSDDVLEYEPPMAGTQKRIDFCIRDAAGQRGWVEVKSISPAWVDDEPGWERYEQRAADFPENARLVVEQDWQGAAVAGQAFKTKYSMLARTAEIEERVSLIPADRQGRAWAMFCSNGLDWHLDELEDFADFYRTGRPRQHDWSANLMARYMEENNIALRRNLNGFIYLERPRREVFAREFRLDVRGPAFGMAGRH
jgi:hypothetical protein